MIKKKPEEPINSSFLWPPVLGGRRQGNDLSQRKEGKKKRKATLKIKIENIKSKDLNLFGSLINNPVRPITSPKQRRSLQLNFLYFLLIFNDSLVT